LRTSAVSGAEFLVASPTVFVYPLSFDNVANRNWSSAKLKDAKRVFVVLTGHTTVANIPSASRPSALSKSSSTPSIGSWYRSNQRRASSRR
jgi:hypothetical protein